MASIDLVKHALHDKLREGRAAVVAQLDGLSEYDVRRPMTATGTNLLGIVKHLIGVEDYLGSCFGRPMPEELPWYADGSVWEGADMWATPDQSRAELLAQYAAACAHSDETITELPLDAPGSVSWWSEGQRDTTLVVLLVRMIEDTARHAGQGDVIREALDGRGGPDRDEIGDEAHWTSYVARIAEAAERFRD